MRPMYLQMQAFGPYSGLEVVDFSRLQKSSLFLITGPTGAGKTTIFDAISVALYGDVSGSERTAESLRSHFAEPDVLTQIIFEFELHGILYHVERIPKQMKPKQRGDGWTEQKSDAILSWNQSGKKQIITGVTDVNQAIIERLGMNVDQFKQIMMIPQGEFKQLLIADSKEREKILQQLFDTSFYRNIQDALIEGGKAAEASIRKIREEKSMLLGQFLWKKQENEELRREIKEALEDQADTKIIEWVREGIRQDMDDERHFRQIGQRVAGSREKLMGDVERQLVINDQLRKKEDIEAHLKDLLAKKDEMEVLNQENRHVQRIETVIPIENSMIEVGQYLEKQEKRKEELQKNLAEWIKKWQTLGEESQPYTTQVYQLDIETQKNKLAKWQEHKAQLQEQMRIMKEKKHLEDQIDTTKQYYEKLESQIQETISRQNEEKERLETYRDAGLSLAQKKIAFAEIEHKRSGIFQIKEDFKELEVKKNNVFQQEKILQKKSEEHEEKYRNYLREKKDYYLSQALILADTLEENEPCPVCGSLDHPSPAKHQAKEVTKEMLAQIEGIYQKVDQEKHAIQERCHLLKDEVNKQEIMVVDKLAEQGIKDQESLDSLLVDLLRQSELLSQEIQDFQQAFHRVQDQERKCLKLQQQLESLLEIKDQLIKGLHDNQNQLAKMDALYERYQMELGKDSLSMQTLSEKILELKKDLTDQENKRLALEKELQIAQDKKVYYEATIKEIEENIVSRRKEAIKLEETFQETIIREGFEGRENYEKFKAKKETLSKNLERYENYRRQVDDLQSSLKTYSKETQAKLFKDVKGLRERTERFKKRQEALMEVANSYRQRYEQNERVLDQYDKLQEKVENEEKAYETWGRIAKIAGGDNTYRMTFERYVLAAFLEQILIAANLRLKIMSQGRYALSRTEALERKNKQSGLELEVFDQYTGKSRHVKTLSGGETFKASLAMALGLADVVQSYSGGVRLDTIFIDEGFGTLDQESLEHAITCLMDLKKNGRLVGIISHVEALKEQIPIRLEISSDELSSHAQFSLVGQQGHK